MDGGVPKLPAGYTAVSDDNIPPLPKGFTPIEKKSPVGNVSPNGSPSFSNGLNPFQSSPQSGMHDVIAKTPEMRAQLDRQTTPVDPALKQYWNKLNPDEQKALSNATDQSQQQHANESLRAPTQNETADYNYGQTLPGKIQNGLTYLAQKATKGGLQVVKGAAYLAQLGGQMQSGLPSTDTHESDKFFQKADKATDLLPKGVQSHIEDNAVMSNLGGISEYSIPMALSGLSGGATMYLQGLGQGKENIDQAEANGAKIDPTVKNAYILGNGLVQGFLMGETGSNIFKSLGTGLKNDVVSEITTNAIKDAAGKELTTDQFNNLLKQRAKAWEDKALQFGTNFLEKSQHAITNLGALKVSDFALKKGVDIANQATGGQSVFNETPGNLVEGLGNAIKTGLAFGAAGSIGDVSKLTPFSQYNNTVMESLLHDSSDENIAKTKQFITEQGQQQGWTPDEIQATQNHVDEIAKVTKSIPKGLDPEKAQKAVDLVIGRNELQKQAEQIAQDKAQLDPVFQEQTNPGEQLVNDKIEQANDKLLDIANGTKTTYSKGTGDDEGKFFKTTNGKQEEIDEGRYNLEKTEREAKAANNFQNTSLTEKQKEEPEKYYRGEVGGSITPGKGEPIDNSNISGVFDMHLYDKLNDEKTPETGIWSKDAIRKELKRRGLPEVEPQSEENVLSNSGVPDNAPEIAKPRYTIKGEEVKPKGENQDAIQEQETGKMGVREQGTVRPEVGSNDQSENIAQQGEKSQEKSRQKAIDAVTHGIVVPEKIMGRDPSARFDFGMTTADKEKAVRDIKNGKYETAPAKKMLSKLQEWDKNDEYPIIEGLGGTSQRARFATSKDIQDNIDEAKANKIGELSQRQIDEFNESAKDLGITVDDIKAHEDYEQARHNPEARGGVSETVQQPENDKGTGATQSSGSKTSQGVDELELQHGNAKQPDENIAPKAKALADRMRALKSDKNKAYGGLQGVATAVYDGAIETAATIIENGGKLIDAIQAAVDHIRKNSKETDDDKIRAAITKDFAEAGISDEKQSITSARNEDTDKTRERLGLSPLMKEAERANPKVWDEVNKTLDENPNATDELISKLDHHMRPVTDLEQGLLIHRQIELETNVQKANELVIDNHEKGIDDKWDKINLFNARKALSDMLDLQEKVGREWGLSGKFRQQLFKDDFSLANLERQTRGAVGGRELTESEHNEIQKVHDDCAKKVKEYEDVIKGLRDKQAKEDQQKAEKKLQQQADFEARKAKREGKVIDYDKAIEINLDKARKKLAELAKNPQSTILPYARELAEIAPELGEIAKAYIGKGITKLEDIVDNIHHDLSEAMPGLDKRAVRDALSGYGKEPKERTKDELQQQLAELKQQAKLISKLEDLKNGIERKSPRVQKERNENIVKLQEQIRELTKGETVNKAYITRMNNMQKDIQERLNKGDFEKKVRLPVELTPEARAARAEYLNVKREFDRALEKKRLADRPAAFKLADWFAKWRRFVLFINPTTFAKLGTYATMEMLSKPLHEIVGSGVKRLPYFSKVAEKAPREGAGFNPHVEAKAFAQLWAKGTWDDIRKNVTNKEGALKASHSDNLDSTPDMPWLDIGQNLHSAIKEIPLHAEVERSIYLRTMHAMKNQIDVSNPMVQLKIVAESLKDNLPGSDIKQIEDKAYQDGLRSILMQDNLVSNSYSKINQYLEQVAETGKISKNIDATERIKSGAKGLSTMMKVMIPITKVPINYVISRLEYTPIIGAAKALLVMRRGLKEMTPDDADYVMRIMKKQGVSAGLLALGYLNPTNFGGFSTTSNKRREGQLKANDIKLFGVKIPHFMSHTPFLTMLQLGATMRHIHDNYIEGTMTDSHIEQARKSHWYSDAPLALTKDVAKQVPFIETPSQVSDAIRNKEAITKFAADFMQGLVLPPDVKTLAKAQDTHANGEPVDRKVKGFGDELKSNIPGLRETLPRK